MKSIKILWRDKNNSKGRIDITFFFINLFLLICHFILMFIYLVIGHKLMIIFNFIFILIYITQRNNCYKKPKLYSFISFFEIWIHMILAVLSFGLAPCFQNWSFALIAAYFLPVYTTNRNDKKTKRQSFIFTFIIIITYFLMPILIQFINVPNINLDEMLNSLLFIFNNLFLFIAIIMFAIFYTNSFKEKEAELNRKANYDELTELYNRYAIISICEKMSEDIIKSSKNYNVAIIDIDFFKNVNDKYGHNCGDMVLKELAIILKNYNEELISARWGGEEFVIISKNGVSYNKFKKLMNSLRIDVSKHKFKIKYVAIQLT